jgi:hypothetical protein
VVTAPLPLSVVRGIGAEAASAKEGGDISPHS